MLLKRKLIFLFLSLSYEIAKYLYIKDKVLSRTVTT